MLRKSKAFACTKRGESRFSPLGSPHRVVKIIYFIIFLMMLCFRAYAQEQNTTSPAPALTQQQSSRLREFQGWAQKHGSSQTNQEAPPQAVAAQSAQSTAPVPIFSAAPPSSNTQNSIETQAPPAAVPPPANPHAPRIMTFEESQQAMLNSVPPPSMRPSEDSEAAFNTMLQQNMPLNPQQVVRLHQQIDISQRAQATPPTIPPKPVSTTLMINLAPGTTPPAIRLAQGYVSSLVFVDSTGEPWPVATFDIGNPKAVSIQWDGKSNILLLQSQSPYSYGDMVIRLVGLATPLTIELVSGQRVVDYRVDIHIPRIGPNTKELPVGTTLPDSANQVLLGVLDGVAPPGSRPLTVRGAHADAWLVGSTLFLRTRFTLLSPGWVGTMASPDGMHAYQLAKTSSVLVSRYGEPAELNIEGL